MINIKDYKMSDTTMYNNLEIQSLHHPCGMLDRDQRTIVTLPKNQRDYNKININNNNNNNNYTTSSNNHNISQCSKSLTAFSQNESIKVNYLSSNQLINNNNNNNDYNNNQQQQQQQSVLLNIKSKTNFSRSVQKRTIVRKSSSSTFHFQKTKFSNLLIYICFWLLTLQRARGIPIRRMDDEYNGNGRNHQTNCPSLRDALEKVLHQSNVSYEVNMSSLDNYTQAIFNERHKDQHNMWRKTSYTWLYPDEQPLEIDDYDQELPDHVAARYRLPHVPQMDEVSRELINLYRRLKILNAAIENIREDHERSKHVLINQYPGEKYNHMVKFFSDQYNYLRALLQETESSMIQLGVSIPEIMDQIQEFNGSREIRDWIVTREHLKLLNYVIKVYGILLQRCS